MQSFQTTIAVVERLSPIPGLFVTSAVAYTLLGLQLSNYRGSDGLFQWTQKYKTNLTITVQVLSHLLGLIFIHVICVVLRSSFMLSLRKKAVPIYWTYFIQAATTPRIAWELPTKLLLALLLINVWSLVPAAIWAGALTPLPSSRDTTRSLSIPTFDVANLTQIWEFDQSTRNAGTQWMHPVAGLFSDEAAVTKGLMSSSASDASVITDGAHKHAKLDKTGYSYLGRSYGAGSTVGFSKFRNTTRANWYAYVEDSIYPEVSCFYNRSSRIGMKRIDLRKFGLQITNLYQTAGNRTNGTSMGFTTYMGWVDHDIFLWATSFFESKQMLSIEMTTLANSTDDAYGFSMLNNVQCDLRFKLQPVLVSVNTTSKMIAARLLNSSASEWPRYGDSVTTLVNEWVGSLGFLDTGCSGGCQLGKSIVSNVQQLRNLTGSTSNETTLRGVEDYFTSLADNILVYLHQLRLVGGAPQPTQDVTATINVPAVVFGDLKFIIVISVINFILSVTYWVELIRTRAWAGIPPIDILNICDVLMAAWRGGAHISGSSVQKASQKTSSFNENTKMCLTYDGVLKFDAPVLVPLMSDVQNLPMDKASTIEYANVSYNEKGQQHLSKGRSAVNRKPFDLRGIFSNQITNWLAMSKR